MELQINNVVKTRRGDCGVVASFNKKPFIIIFEGFVCPVDRYNEQLKHKNPNYDIVEVYDGKKVDNYKKVYRKSFDFSTLKLIYKEGEEVNG